MEGQRGVKHHRADELLLAMEGFYTRITCIGSLDNTGDLPASFPDGHANLNATLYLVGT